MTTEDAAYWLKLRDDCLARHAGEPTMPGGTAWERMMVEMAEQHMRALSSLPAQQP